MDKHNSKTQPIIMFDWSDMTLGNLFRNKIACGSVTYQFDNYNCLLLF